MQLNKFKVKPIKLHFILLTFILINFIIELVLSYSLNQYILFFFKIILYISGIILFFTNIKPFKFKAIYFSFYAISLLIIGVLRIAGGLFLAIISSLILFPIYPNTIAYKNNKILIYDKFQGHLGICCVYELKEPILYIFEKKIGLVNIENEINPSKDTFNIVGNLLIYKHEIDNNTKDSKFSKKDTTENITILK